MGRSAKHPGTELIPYLRGELQGAERARVEAHLAGCPECRRAAEATVEIVHDLRRTAPEPPALDWGRWRVELRARLEPRPAWRRWIRPVPAVLSLGLASALIVLAWLGTERRGPPVEVATAPPAAVTEPSTAPGSVSDPLLGQPLAKQIELLEDLDVIVQLDSLAPGQDG